MKNLWIKFKNAFCLNDYCLEATQDEINNALLDLWSRNDVEYDV